MGNHRGLGVLDAAEKMADEINKLIDGAPRRLLHVHQLRKSAQAVSANISEGFGRGRGGDRRRSLIVARGEAEEVISHLRPNIKSGRISQRVFWRLRNRLITIAKMLTSLLNS